MRGILDPLLQRAARQARLRDFLVEQEASLGTKLLLPTEISKLLPVSRPTLRKWQREGKLRGAQFEKHYWYFSETDALRIAEDKKEYFERARLRRQEEEAQREAREQRQREESMLLWLLRTWTAGEVLESSELDAWGWPKDPERVHQVLEFIQRCHREALEFASVQALIEEGYFTRGGEGLPRDCYEHIRGLIELEKSRKAGRPALRLINGGLTSSPV